MHTWYTRLATGLLLIAAKGAFAFTCTTVTKNTTIQPKSMVIQRDLPVGSLIARVESDVVDTFTCSNTEPKLTHQEMGVKGFGTYAGTFDGKRVWKTNIDGIGYAIGILPVSQCDGNEHWVDGNNPQNADHIVVCNVNGMFDVRPMRAKALISFYKTDSTTGTGSVSAEWVGSFILKNGQSPTDWFKPESKISIASFDVEALSCTVSNKLIPVDLGEVPIGAFKGPDTSPSAGTKAFSIPINCAKDTSVNLQLDGAAYDAARGMLKLDAGASSASGVAIQLLYDDRPVELAKRFKWQTIHSDGDYAISLKARYVQTDRNVKPGVANGSATFTLTYQ
ncbi:fimbrial protein [Burkholderia sp. Z1]|uniref:fimbrial protein n=1 Tax=Burkholderia sp. Z1 TaxID=2759039 RepID=UPI001865B866|nr:fimbrial protein [Burkholderia sp. Z1]